MVTSMVARKPQRTLTLEMTNTCRRKNGLVPPSVKGLIRLIQAMSRAHEYQPRCSWRSISARTSRKRRML
ncbi:MAG: hypothetical protein E6J57_10970 [Deltaproteobacteria bacterium]|nr:MAG: hypothetical protein E6J57_10970 [Deltaproteobacteria bacterium]